MATTGAEMVVMIFPPLSIEPGFDYSEQQMCQTSNGADREIAVGSDGFRPKPVPNGAGRGELI